MQEHNIASAWFDDLYKKHENAHHNIPWARKDVNPHLETYLENTQNIRGKALVIGCGLGDDAYALYEAGYDVVAIDVSQTALTLARGRFSDSTIVFEKQDIFDMPDKYYEYFDFVFEALTIQSLPVKFREKMIKAVADTVSKNGQLMIVAHKKDKMSNGPPWPLEQEEIDLFKSHSLKEIFCEIHTEGSKISDKKFRALYQK